MGDCGPQILATRNVYRYIVIEEGQRTIIHFFSCWNTERQIIQHTLHFFRSYLPCVGASTLAVFFFSLDLICLSHLALCTVFLILLPLSVPQAVLYLGTYFFFLWVFFKLQRPFSPKLTLMGILKSGNRFICWFLVIWQTVWPMLLIAI